MAEGIQTQDSDRTSGNLGFDSIKSRVNLIIIGFFFVGLFVFAFGMGMFLFREESKDDVQIISALESPIAISEITVDIDGAVVLPGLYKLVADSRVNDAILAAGGLVEDADRSRINLAAKVVDGQKIYIASEDEVSVANTGLVAGDLTAQISINSASVSELDKLPGVGPVTAGKIVASRPYSSLEELVTKKAVSRSVFEKIKDMVVL